MKRFAIVCLVAGACAASAAAAERVAVVADSSVVLVPNEWQEMHGAKPLIRIKGNQHLLPMAFDVRALKGKMIRSATLVCRQGNDYTPGLTLSTIQAPWDERRSNSITAGIAGVNGWGREGAHFPEVTGGNSFSLTCHSMSDLKGGTYRWEVDPDLIHACAVGASFGVTLHEVVTDYSRNPTIHSRESRGNEPVLLVEFGGRDEKPDPPTLVKVTDLGDPDTMRLHLRSPKHGFAYEITVDGKDLARWNTPFVKPGEEQIVPIRDLPLKPGAQVTIAATTLNRIGERSRTVSIRATVPNPAKPTTPNVPASPKGRITQRNLTVIPVTDKYNESGKPVGTLPADHQSHNTVFDGSTIRLAAAKGEVVGCQVLLKGAGKVTVTCKVPGIRSDLFRALYVDSKAGRIPDPLVPFTELELSQQVATPVVVDVYVPFDEKRRTIRGELRISDGRTVPIELTVRNFAIPKRASFLCEMNGYGMPDSVEEFYRLQRVAYDHRVHANILSYGHSSTAPRARTARMDLLMPNGRRMDEARYNHIAPGAKRGYWVDFAEAFGPFLTGACFKDGHRGPIGAPGFYLTFHESWPLKVREYFNGNPDAFEAFKGKPVYAETFVNVLDDFVATAKREGWTECGFQLYLNNKGSLKDANKSPWILDEPTAYWDYRALRFYGELVEKAKGARPGVTLDYRIDISRPQFDRGQLVAGCSDLWVVGGGAFKEYHRLVMDRKEREGLKVWTYGTTNAVETSNRETMAMVLEVYRGGGVGFVPWQTKVTVGGRANPLKQADQLALFIYDVPENGQRPVRHSMRLKAYRRAEQDIEYLELLRAKMKWTDGQLRAFIDGYVDLTGEVVQAYAEDAGTARFGRLSPEAFRRLREAAAMLLEK